MLYIDQIKALWRQLLPTGRAFWAPVGGWMDTLINALSLSENKFYADMLSTFDSMLADNANFTTQDAADWERRLGLYQYPASPPPGYIPDLATRKAAILQQYNYPGTTLPRAFYLYIQDQLRAAGFDVYVYENRFYIGGQWVTQDPLQIVGTVGELDIEFGLIQDSYEDLEFGEQEFGGRYGNIIANSVERVIDENFEIEPNLRSTFFIGGPSLSTQPFAYVPQAQEEQFRQLILKLKPVQTVGYLFIVYT